jgi:hypothetical protein
MYLSTIEKIESESKNFFKVLCFLLIIGEHFWDTLATESRKMAWD